MITNQITDEQVFVIFLTKVSFLVEFWIESLTLVSTDHYYVILLSMYRNLNI